MLKCRGSTPRAPLKSASHRRQHPDRPVGPDTNSLHLWLSAVNRTSHTDRGQRRPVCTVQTAVSPLQVTATQRLCLLHPPRVQNRSSTVSLLPKPDAFLVFPHTSAGVHSSRRYRRSGTDARSAAAASAAAQPLGRRAATICRAGRPGCRHRRPAAAAGVRRDHVQRRDRGLGTGVRGPGTGDGGDGGTITGMDSDGGVSVLFPVRRDVTLLLIVQKLGMILKLD